MPLSCHKIKYPYYQIDDIQIQAYKDSKLNSVVLQTDSLTSDTTYLTIQFVGKNIAFHQLNFNFSNCAYAFKKRFDGDQGLKDKITNMLFYSNKLFNGRAPGTSLNDFFVRVGNWPVDWQTTMNTSSSKDFEHNPNRPKRFLLIKRPQDSLRHSLTLELTFESGIKKTSTSKIIWK